MPPSSVAVTVVCEPRDSEEASTRSNTQSSPLPTTQSDYLPPRRKSASSTGLNRLHSQKRGVAYVRVQWVDLVNTVVRFRILPVSYFTRLCETARPEVGLSHVTLGLVGLNAAEGFNGTGEHLYVIDLNSFRLCPYAPGQAVVMGWFQEKAPLPNGSLANPLCPRTLLKHIVDEAQAKAGLFLAGFESEFILLSAISPKPVTVVDGDDLQEAGFDLQMIDAESAPGQFEVVTDPLSPLEAADAVVHTRETIYNVASTDGLHATFAPQLHADNCRRYAYACWDMDNKDAPIRLRGT
ncbi:uncharacterized protein B0H18DRAFT_956515 [Fomitopsis serialis]|uniref:uncharacterized protein n=1 Tax=Fomitopsis serialis TaxID=139415 RepID=UPI0020088341|nr:uncharacterized protein B0H18DRAFT_956515 [Neoantrodia serialis]KAH9921783.1 hypothetical protein B0H18DRAFT_956515 [Neoantrodia serialis]